MSDVPYLLDTHTLLWFLDGDSKLSRGARDAITTSRHRYVSIASLWEITIKSSLGNMRPLPPRFDGFLTTRSFTLLPITMPHLLRLQTLPHHHRDPFDRMLIAQAQAERLTILTADRAILQYDVATRAA